MGCDMFYVYEWFIIETGEIFYVGKGTNRRYKVRKHNKMFNEFVKRFHSNSRIIAEFSTEQEAFEYEYKRIEELREQGQCVCNIKNGGFGGTVSDWNDEKRKRYSEHNVMKSEKQRSRMKENNPMKNPNVKAKVIPQKMRPVVINGNNYSGVKEASKILGVWDITVIRWCKRGYDLDGNPCRYADEKQKEYKLKTTNSKAVWVDEQLFPTVREAAKFLNVWPESIIRSIKNNALCKGRKCRYDNQQPSRRKSDNSTTEGSTTNR